MGNAGESSLVCALKNTSFAYIRSSQAPEVVTEFSGMGNVIKNPYFTGSGKYLEY